MAKNTIMPPFAGLVLAGGKSSRMGKDKATLTHNGMTWLECAAELLQQVGAQQVLVNTHQSTEYQHVTEQYPNLGPLSGIHAGLKATNLPLLVLAVDMPTLSLQNLQVFLSHCSDYECVYFTDSPLPCFVQNTPYVVDAIEQSLTDDNASKSLFANWKRLSSTHVESTSALQNFNSPEDLAAKPG